MPFRRLPYRGTAPPVTLLQLVSSGGGNIPTASFLDDCIFLTSVDRHRLSRSADSAAAASADLQRHRRRRSLRARAGGCRPSDRADRARRSSTIPRAVMKTGRIGNARRLRAVPGVVTPRTVAIARDLLAGPDGVATIAKHGFTFPLLLRSPGYHTGRNFILVERGGRISRRRGTPSRRRSAGDRISRCPRQGRQRAQIPRDDDRQARSIRCTLRYPENWKVHYFTSDMADKPDHRREEEALSPRHAGDASETKRWRRWRKSGTRSASTMPASISGSAADGDLLLFEANATMVIAPPDRRRALGLSARRDRRHPRCRRRHDHAEISWRRPDLAILRGEVLAA